MQIAGYIYSLCFLLIPSHAEQMKARLVNGNAPWNGRLEILHQQRWTSVCNNFGNEEAQAACRMLGYNSFGARAVDSGEHEAGTGPILFNNLKCQGTEPALAQCKHDGLVFYDCQQSQDVGVICVVVARSGQLRLADAPFTQPNMGYVQIQFGSEWYSVCFRSDEPARVICRQLNLPSESATFAPLGFFVSMKNATLTVNVECEGLEDNILECNRSFQECHIPHHGVFCSQSPSLYILIHENIYPLLEGTAAVLACGSPRLLPPGAQYTWPKTAGGAAFHQNYIFENLTRADHGRRVTCMASYISNGTTHTVSRELELQVYYRPNIKITRSDNPDNPLTDDSNHTVVTPGRDVIFGCKADSNPPPASITWPGNINGSTGDLQILAADPAVHGGVYTCTVVTGTAPGDRLPLTSSRQITVVVKGILRRAGFTDTDTRACKLLR